MYTLYKRYLKYYKKEVILGPLFKLLEAVFELIVPLIMAKIIDNGINGRDSIYVWKMGGLLVLVAIIGLCTTLVCQYFAAKASQGVGTRLRNDTFKAIEAYSFREFDNFDAATLLTRMNNDINQVQLSVAMLIRLVIRAPFLIVGATILSLLINLKITLIFICAAILVLLFALIIMRITVRKNSIVAKKLDKVTTIAKENLNGTRVVRAFNQEEYEKERFYKATEELKSSALLVNKISALLNPASTIIINLGIILILYFGGGMVNQGNISQGDITALVNYMNQILVALLVVCNLITIFSKALASSKRVLEVLDTKANLTYGKRCNHYNEKYVYQFENVSFSYSSRRTKVLNNLNFEIKKGEFVGIIGTTGSGKTSLVNLLGYYYASGEGSIKYHGCDISDYSKDVLKNEIAVAMQRVNVASMSIRDNMKWANKHTSDEEIIKCLELAKADFALSKGLDYEIYQGGKNLSGGEKQRLSLARALLKKPEVLILDNSLSALDFKTEYEVRKNLKKLKLTTIMVTERVASIMKADKIIVLDDGKMVGYGTHLELLAKCPLYLDIYNAQMEEANNE